VELEQRRHRLRRVAAVRQRPGDDIDDALLEVVRHGSKRSRDAALPQLVRAGDADALALAIEIASHGARNDRYGALRALADAGSPAATDALLDIRLQYSPSTGPQGRRGFDPFSDYSGQRYLLVFKASGVPALRRQPLLRYLELSVGYGARHFEPEARGFAPPSRHLYYGVSLNLSEVLRSTAFSGNASPSRTQRVSETFFEFVQLPGVVAARDHEIR
jgi:hypothetical protein